MRSKYCENCGTILECGICSNCQEELFILAFQGEDIQEPLSNEFYEKAEEQKEEVKNAKQKPII